MPCDAPAIWLMNGLSLSGVPVSNAGTAWHIIGPSG
jgi:hypothetical protein